MRTVRTTTKLGLAVTILSMATLAACASKSSSDTSNGFAAESGGAKSVTLLQQPWDDLEAENEISKQILDKVGYDVSVKDVSVELGAKAMSKGEIDGYLGNWWPSQQPTFGKLIKAKDVDVQGQIVNGTQYAPAVPGDVSKRLKVTSLADLAAHGAAFDHKIYGIEAGTPGNATIQKAIDDNAYGLGGWTLVQSSTAAMLTQVQKAEKNHQAIVFLGWSPHWMTVQFHTVFLKDPKHVWGGAGEIRTLTRSGFAQKNPAVTAFLKNLKFTTAEAGQFYYQHDKQAKSFSDIAAAWIKANPDKVSAFLAGVKDANGKPASQTFSG